METKSRFPLAVKRDSVTVKIYRACGRKKYVTYVVIYREGGERKRQTYSLLEAAKAEAGAIAERLAKGSGEIIQLKGANRVAYPPPTDVRVY